MITGERNISISGHVTKAVKLALAEECKSQDVSQSKYISDAIEEKLKRDGVLIVEPAPAEEEPPLPFDEDEVKADESSH